MMANRTTQPAHERNWVKRVQLGSLSLGILAALLCIAGILQNGAQVFYRSYLPAFLFWAGLSLGSVAIGMLHYLVGGQWGLVIRRAAEAGMKTIWLAAVFFLPLVFGLGELYPWAQPQVVAADSLLQHKSPYLNVPFFLIRAVLYFALWGGLVLWTTRWSQRTEFNLDPERRRVFQRLNAIGIVVYAVLMTFASLDWIMSLQPAWFSTIYGMLIVTEQALAGLALSIFTTVMAIRNLPMQQLVSRQNYRDLGALLLTTLVFWSYLAFMQYLIIWGGNLPREAIWYVDRISNGWLWVGFISIGLQFGLPFLVLLSSEAKRRPWLLFGLGFLILVGSWVDYIWQVKPAFYPQGVTITWLDIACTLALGGLWVAAYLWHLERTPNAYLLWGQPIPAGELPQESARA